MAYKSSLNEVIAPDDQPGVQLSIQADSSGFLVVSMSDGKGVTVSMKLNQADAGAFARIASFANALRQVAPQ